MSAGNKTLIGESGGVRCTGCRIEPQELPQLEGSLYAGAVRSPHLVPVGANSTRSASPQVRLRWLLVIADSLHNWPYSLQLSCYGVFDR